MLRGILDVRIDQKSVCLGMNALHNLETIEAVGLCSLDPVRESLDEVLVDDAV